MNKLLIIEPDDVAYKSIKLQLKKIGFLSARIIRCSLLCDIANINVEEIEIVLATLSLPDSECKSTFKKVKRRFPFTPIIVLAVTSETEVAIGTIRQGALDYLVKGEFNLKILEKAIQYGIERNRIFDKMLSEKRELRTMINNTKDIIWSVDKNHNVISANEAFWERVYKVSGKTKAKVSIADFDKDLINSWTRFYEQAMKGELKKVIWKETNNDGKTYEEVRFNLIRDKDDNIVGVSCFSRDITKHYIHVKMIRKQNERLRKIAWIQSHMVRGPVATIIGIANLFNMDDPSDPENMELVEHIKSTAHKLDEVIRKIDSYTTNCPLGMPARIGRHGKKN